MLLNVSSVLKNSDLVLEFSEQVVINNDDLKHEAVTFEKEAVINGSVKNVGGVLVLEGKISAEYKTLCDRCIRSGTDIFKALALGADAVLICRPFVTAVYGGAEEGVKLYIEKLGAELKDTMQMCGAHSLKEITKDMVHSSC